MRTHPDIRQSMQALPAWLQPMLTWLTGKPLPGQAPLITWNPWTRLIPNVFKLGLGLAMAAWILTLPTWAWLLLPIAWLLASGGFRGLYLELAHAAVHHAFAKTKKVNQIVTEALTTISLTPGYHEFRGEHVSSHHGATATIADPDYAALVSFGFTPGLSEVELRRRAAWSWLNPTLHARYLWSRLRGNFARGPWYRRLLAVAWHGGILATVAATDSWMWFGVAYLVPLTWGYQMSSVLQMLAGEHRWNQDVGKGRERLHSLTYGRMLGEAFPTAGGFVAKSTWWLRLLTYHVPAKLMVFVGNDIGPAHDLHHRKPHSDWSNAAFTRQQMIDDGTFGPHEDVWGSLGVHIAYSLRGMASGSRSTS
ncbi:MAG: hypothetical protein AB8H80_23740 [Planctomycetota bacterium]